MYSVLWYTFYHAVNRVLSHAYSADPSVTVKTKIKMAPGRKAFWLIQCSE